MCMFVCRWGVRGVCAQGVAIIPHFQLCLHISRCLMLIEEHVELVLILGASEMSNNTTIFLSLS